MKRVVWKYASGDAEVRDLSGNCLTSHLYWTHTGFPPPDAGLWHSCHREGTYFEHSYSVVFLPVWTAALTVLPTVIPAHPHTHIHTLVEVFRETSGPSIPSRWSKFNLGLFFCSGLCFSFAVVSGRVFFGFFSIPSPASQRAVQVCGLQGKTSWPRVVWPTGPGPASFYSAWLNKQQQERGEGSWGTRGPIGGVRRSSPRQAGWPRCLGYTGSPFFSHPRFVLSEWGQLLLSSVEGRAFFTFETVQDSPLPPSVIHKHPSPVLDKPGGARAL